MGIRRNLVDNSEHLFVLFLFKFYFALVDVIVIMISIIYW